MIVARRIVADIDRLGLECGGKLPPEKVMLADYRVGRGTLRESLRYLELQGVLSLKPGPGGGPVVQQPDSSMLATSLGLLLHFAKAPVRVLVEARVGLEPMVASVAARHVTAELLDQLAETIDAMEEHLDSGAMFEAADRRCHELVASASGNALFSSVIEALLAALDGAQPPAEMPRHRRVVVLASHRKIYTALRAKDADAAHAAMRDHVEDLLRYADSVHPDTLEQCVSWDALAS